MKKYISEFIGTLVLVLFGCGIAVVSGGDLVATSLAFGLAIVACAYAIGGISGCHVNPAVSLAMLIRGDITLGEFVGYVISQVLGAIAGAGILYLILASTTIGTASLGTNGFGSLSASNISLVGALVTEVILTFVFVLAILGVTSAVVEKSLTDSTVKNDLTKKIEEAAKNNQSNETTDSNETKEDKKDDNVVDADYEEK